ncbi:MAG: HlyD family type I secretion periplasmic adaptor subunit [Rhodocyclaceae bacterium]|nr:HlyD family type I secretion periplasmic adaptor subunit [Rhodocyclaceae bacterium]
MEPAVEPPVGPPRPAAAARPGPPAAALEFLPDADAIEQRPMHRGRSLTLHVLLALLVILLIWASIAEVDEVVVARGKLVTPLPNIVLQPLETSIVQSIDVRVGQVVKKGATLAHLDPTFASADAAQLRARVQSLDAQLERLQAEQDGKALPLGNHGGDSQLQERIYDEKRANYAARLTRLNESLDRLRAAISTNRLDIGNLESRVGSLREIETMLDNLSKKEYVSKMKLLESRERRQEVERELELARNRSTELQKELQGAEAERNAFTREWRQKTIEELVAVKRERDALNEQLQKANRRSTLVTLNAPDDAVVLEIAQRSVGSVVKEAEPLFTLVPLGTELEAEARIDAADIGFVKAGDPVRIKVDAFPFQKHNVATGDVRTLSEDAFTRTRAELAAATQSDAYYLTRIRITGTPFRNLPRGSRLTPGMTLAAEINVGKRSVISYFLYPLIRSLDEAIREP